MEQVEIAVIGAGVVGLAVAHALSGHFQGIIVLEQHSSFGQETSSRNSEVIHSGIYYPPESLKTKLCIRGRRCLYEFCSRHKVPFHKLGKLLVATNACEQAVLQKLVENASACGIENVRSLSRSEVLSQEPSLRVRAAVLFEETGIVDSHALMNCLLALARSRGVDFSFSVKVVGIAHENNRYRVTVQEPNGERFSFLSNWVINCAGLNAPSVDEFLVAGNQKKYRLYPCKGQYFRIMHPEKFGIRHLVYPPPTAVSLGIHLTPDLAGGLRLGPDAQYVTAIDYAVRESDKTLFFESARTYLPDLSIQDLVPDIAGIRPKLQGPDDQFQDFIVKEESPRGLPRLINLIGIESPGLTASLALGEYVREVVAKN